MAAGACDSASSVDIGSVIDNDEKDDGGTVDKAPSGTDADEAESESADTEAEAVVTNAVEDKDSSWAC
jgi:hypothetical protein